MQQMDKVKIAFVGTGTMGQCAHLRNYSVLPECEVVAISELRPNLAEKVAAKYRIANYYTDYEEMFDRHEIDGVVAAQSFTRHGVIVPDLLSRCKHVFTEKPIAASMTAAEKILTAAKDNDTKHYLGYHKRSDPAIMHAKELVDQWKQSKKYGALKYVRILIPPGEWIQGGFYDLVTSDDPMPELKYDPSDGDMDVTTWDLFYDFISFYVHQINLMRHLMGEDIDVVFAEPTKTVMNLQSESGVPGIIEMEPYKTTVDWQESVLVCFEKAWIKVSIPAPMAHNRPGSVEIFTDPGMRVTPEHTRVDLPWMSAMRMQAVNFCKAIKGLDTPLCTAEEACSDLEICRDYINMLQQSRLHSREA